MPYIVFDTKILNALLSNLKHPEKTVSLDRIMVNFFMKFLENEMEVMLKELLVTFLEEMTNRDRERSWPLERREKEKKLSFAVIYKIKSNVII